MTWQSIGEALLHRTPTTLADVTVRSPLSLYGQSELLLSIGPGIITTADLTDQFEQIRSTLRPHRK